MINGIERLCGVPDSFHPAQESWLRSGREGYLKCGSRFYRGRWQHRRDEWIFTFGPWCKTRLPPDENEVEFLDEHWGRLARLVLDPAKKWTPGKFQAARGKSYKLCVLCSLPVSENRADYYRTEPNVVVCRPCYEQFVAKRSLAFVPGVSAAEEPASDSEEDDLTTLELTEPADEQQMAVK